MRLTPKRSIRRILAAPGATYRVVAWGVEGTRDRSQLPRVLTVKNKESSKFMPTCMEALVHLYLMHTVYITAPSAPRHLTTTRVFDDGIELNWIPPREPNGDVRHYIIKYTTQNGTKQEINTANNINYYNLTGLERGQTYKNIRVVAVNSAGGGGGSQPITSYVHTPIVESTSELELRVMHNTYFTYKLCCLNSFGSSDASEELLQYTHSQIESLTTSKNLMHVYICA